MLLPINVNDLLGANLVSQTITNRPRSPLQQYTLTVTGQQLKQLLNENQQNH